MKLRYFAMSALLMITASFASLTACDDIDKSLDCSHLCDEYATCIGGSEFDKKGCTNSCKDWADENKTNEGILDDCSACLDGDQSCAEKLRDCGLKCAFIPKS